MKKITAAIFVLACALNLSAQQDSMKLIFPHMPKKISGFVGPTVSLTSYNGQFSVMSGGMVAFLIKDFYIGAFGTSRQNELESNNQDDFSFIYGGIISGYSILAKKAIHPTISLSAGWGNIEMNADLTEPPYKDRVFVLTPTAEVEANITKFMRASVGLTYNYTMGVNNSGLNNNDFSNFGGVFSMRFGWFSRNQ